MSAHESAPWWVTSSGIRNSGGYICFTHAVQRHEGQDERYEREVAEREASRRLIASAPELLEATFGVDILYAELQSSLPSIANTPSWDIVQDAVRKARDARRKATGE